MRRSGGRVAGQVCCGAASRQCSRGGGAGTMKEKAALKMSPDENAFLKMFSTFRYEAEHGDVRVPHTPHPRSLPTS